MLDQHEMVSYLLQRKLLQPEDVVMGGLEVADASRRHRNFRIAVSCGRGYLVKQGVGEGKAASVACEAAVYRALAQVGGAASQCLPHLRAYDHQARLLVLDLIEGADNLREYYQHSGRFSLLLARAMGRVLATLHSLPVASDADAPGLRLPEIQPPWVLGLALPQRSFFEECSAANVQLVRTIQAHPGFGSAFGELLAGWRSDGLVHGDLRWDNFLVFAKIPGGRRTRVKVVDWELAGRGDRCWDVGSVFSDYLSFWLLSIPLTDELELEQLLRLARYPLEKMLPALHTFWSSYIDALGLEPVEAELWLLRSVRYAAARLLQTAFEQMQTSIQLTGAVYCTLQLSLNILERPREAALQLLRIPLGGLSTGTRP